MGNKVGIEKRIPLLEDSEGNDPDDPRRTAVQPLERDRNRQRIN
jgi:hypothetical protein